MHGPQCGDAGRHVESHSDQRFDEPSVHVKMAFVLRDIAFRMRLIEHTPLLWRKLKSVLETLKYSKSVFGTVAVPPKCGE